MNHPICYPATIRSFVLRTGHLSIAQKRALSEGMPRWGIPYAPEPLDLSLAFGRVAPCFLEIGFGMGNATAQIAAAHPQYDYLAIDVHPPGIGNLCKLIDEKALTNLRIIQHDAVDVVKTMLIDSTLDGIHIFFPDPWPKKRHHKRRLIQPPFIGQLVKKLKPHGYVHAATDWEPYAYQILEVFNDQGELENVAGTGFSPRPAYRPDTKFEQRGIRLGHSVADIIFRRIPTSTPI